MAPEYTKVVSFANTHMIAASQCENNLFRFVFDGINLIIERYTGRDQFEEFFDAEHAIPLTSSLSLCV